MILAAALLAVAAAAPGISSSALPEAPMVVRAIQVKKSNFNRYDYAIYASVVAYRTMDYITTEHQIHQPGGYEYEIPIALAKSRVGFAAFSAGMAVAEIGASVYLHRHGHAKLARVADTISVGAGWTQVSLNKINTYK